MEETIFWVVAAVVLFVVEVVTVNTVSICLVGGCILALVMAVLGLPLWLQLIGFVLGSTVIIMTARKKLKGAIGERRPALTDNIPDHKVAVVTETISPGSKGQIKLDGVFWMAVALDENETIPKGTRVLVCHRDKTLCTVSRYEEVNG